MRAGEFPVSLPWCSTKAMKFPEKLGTYCKQENSALSNHHLLVTLQLMKTENKNNLNRLGILHESFITGTDHNLEVPIYLWKCRESRRQYILEFSSFIPLPVPSAILLLHLLGWKTSFLPKFYTLPWNISAAMYCRNEYMLFYRLPFYFFLSSIL